MIRKTHNLIQGTPEWHEFRAAHFGASEAAAMLGVSPYTTRAELLRRKHTGVAPTHDERTLAIFANGHRVEELARPLVEEMIGEELYPVVMSYGKLSASCDGLTLEGTIAFEHKQWNQKLADSLRDGILPEEHQPQAQQILAVTGAKHCYFVCSDGTEDNFAYLIVTPDLAMFDRLASGWAQFEKDLAVYKPQEIIPAAVAAPVMGLPAVSIQVTGAVALTSNLGTFHEQLQAFIKKIPAKPSTDQEFADCKAAVKALKDAEDALDAAEKQALGQVASFDDMRRAKQLCFDLSRQTRLALEKLVVARERQIKEEIITTGRMALAAHIESLDTMLGGFYMPTIPDRFVDAIKAKRTVAALQNAVDTELARLKIEADSVSRTIQANLNTLDATAADHKFLFADLKSLLTKNPDDFEAQVWLRISQHKADEAKRAEQKAMEEARLAEQKAAAALTAETMETAVTSHSREANTVIMPFGPAPVDPPPRPASSAIVMCVAREFDVLPDVAELWLRELFGGRT
jgi:putative phage-type endonuclease